jgi:hypothetical protein
MLSLLVATLAGAPPMPTPFVPTSSASIPANVPLQMSWVLPTRCLDTPRAHSAHVQQVGCLPVGQSQSWRFLPQSDGSYLIVNSESGGCLDVEAHSYALGARVLDWACHGLANQRWHVSSQVIGNAHRALISSAHSGLCLDIQAQGAFQMACNRGATGQPIWTLLEDPVRRERVGSNLFQLSVTRGGLCAREVGSWVDLGPCQASHPKTNRMTIVPVSYNPVRFQLMLASGRCLGGTPGSGWLWASSVTCNPRDAIQVWEANRSGNALQLRNRGNNGLCLNAKDGASKVGTWLIHWPCSPASDNATWSLVAELK